jgi:hypothetical protein
MRGEGSALVAHELGHILGLRHGASLNSVMGSRGQHMMALSTDDKARLLALYSGRQARR